MVFGLRMTGARRHTAQLVVDIACWSAALVFAVLLRFEFDISGKVWLSVALLCAVAALAQTFVGWALGLYRGRYYYGSFEEARSLVAAVCWVGLLLFLVGLISYGQTEVPRSVVLIAVPIAVILMGAVRYGVRVLANRQYRPDDGAQPALVYGAGHLGENLIRNMLRDSRSPYLPVGLVDDDPGKQRLRILGVPVLGTGDDLAEIADRTGAEALIFCVAGAEAALLREVSDKATAANLRLMVLPVLSEILDGQDKLRSVRDIAIEDIIGRHPVDTDVASIAGYIKGKRVLVTGAGGSIGSELCRQISRFDPSELIMLDRDETGLQTTQLSIHGHGLLDSSDVVLADIRDASALAHIFDDRQPEVVFHAAALKHLPMLEQYPEEGWKTNVLGTLRVIEQARRVGVETFVNISTDKAANPTSVLGHTKRLAEQLTAWAAANSDTKFLSVRFGNVLGSRGSMLPVFTAQIDAGGPLTVTHPDVTRYFMTIPEACQLVVQAGAIGRDGEVMILDMGEPVRILDVAERMIAMSGKDIDIRFTGLRPGEKLHEDLVDDDVLDSRPFHEHISHASIQPLDPEMLGAERPWIESGRNASRAAAL